MGAVHVKRWIRSVVVGVAMLALPAVSQAATPPVPVSTTIAKVVAPTVATSLPVGGRTVLKLTPTETFGGPAQLPVIGQETLADGTISYHVRLNMRPNGSTGWVSSDRIVTITTPLAVVIDLSDRTVDVYRAGKLLRSISAVVGASGTPTPTGDFYIAEAIQRSPKEFTGTWILPFAYSNVLDQFDGGPGRVAIHGRGPQSLADAALGTARSHGCVRIDNNQVSWLAKILQGGTPVHVQR